MARDQYRATVRRAEHRGLIWFKFSAQEADHFGGRAAHKDASRRLALHQFSDRGKRQACWLARGEHNFGNPFARLPMRIDLNGRSAKHRR
jgi:hypothetical protein